MSFVGTRPEVTKYVKKYTKEMRATLLLPAGITSEASIQYKDEAELFLSISDWLILLVLHWLFQAGSNNGKKMHIKALDFLENLAFFKPLIVLFS